MQPLMIDENIPPGGIIELDEPVDWGSVDPNLRGPNGEEPPQPQPKPTLEWLFYQYQQAAKRRDRIEIEGYDDVSEVIGEYREITPCPSRGKISFRQIGAVRLKEKEINLDDEDLLLCRKPVATGELDDQNNPIFRHPDPTNDPQDFYSALYGHNYDVYRAKVLPMNPLNAWNESFSEPHPLDNEQEENGYGFRGVQVKEDDDGEYFRVFSSSRSVYGFYGYRPDGTEIWKLFYYPKATYCTAYVGRIPAGTRLEWAVEVRKTSGDWRSESGSFQIRGMPEGFMSGSYPDDMKEYYAKSLRATSGWQTFSGELTIDDRYQDLILSFQQNGSDSTTAYQNIYFRNFQIWRV